MGIAINTKTTIAVSIPLTAIMAQDILMLLEPTTISFFRIGLMCNLVFIVISSSGYFKEQTFQIFLFLIEPAYRNSVFNQILVDIDSYTGVDIDTCAALSNFIESKLDRDIEDYAL